MADLGSGEPERERKGKWAILGEEEGVNAEWEEWGKQEAEWAGQAGAMIVAQMRESENDGTPRQRSAQFRLNNARVDGFLFCRQIMIRFRRMDAGCAIPGQK